MGKIQNLSLRRTCLRCGKEYHPTSSRQKYCNSVVTAVCENCRKEFETTCGPYMSRTCSKECTAELSNKARRSSAQKQTKTCKWCGEEFVPQHSREKYCSRNHFQTCVICGAQFEVDVRSTPVSKTCSIECENALRMKSRNIQEEQKHLKATMMQRYGVENAMKLRSSIDKIKETNKSKYGAEWYTQTEDYKESVKRTSREKYGVDHFLSSQEVINKRAETCMEKYGYGNYGFLMVDHPEKLDKWIKFRKDGPVFIQGHYQNKPSRNQLSEDLGVSYSTISSEILRQGIEDYVLCSVSYMEEEVVAGLQEIDPSIKIERRRKNIIPPYELDIYLPEYKIAIECNPTYTHNSSRSSFTCDPKPTKYHQMKTECCEASGIFLFHIFGYEWKYKRDIILSMLRNLLGKNKEIIYARNCTVCNLSKDASEALRFLDDNHRQGRASSSVYLGLKDQNNCLVSVMTFGKMRGTIGTDHTDTSNCWELVRFCNIKNTSVVGGASKLFKHFVDKYNPTQIRSFSDRAHTKGTLYETLGFKEIRRSTPGYGWVDLCTDAFVNRVSAQKSNLRHFFHDSTIDLTKSESQIMTEHGFVKVFDSGTITWEWTK